MSKRTIRDKANALDPHSGKVGGICSSIGSICSNTEKHLCCICKNKHHDLLQKDFRSISLKNFLSFSIDECWQYFEKHKLWRRKGMNEYAPHISNKFAKPRKLTSLRLDQLTLGEIRHVFQKFIEMKKESYKTDNDIYFDEVEKQDPLLNIQLYQVKDFLYYNINSQRRSFDIMEERPKNTSFSQCDINIPDFSEQKLTIKDGGTKAINKVPELTIKQNIFEKLSDQIRYYLDNFDKLIALQRDQAITSNSGNKDAINDYLYHIEQIEGVVESNTSQVNNYVQDTFCDIKNKREENVKRIHGKDFLDKASFDIAPAKRSTRAVQKIIISHNGDITKSTDSCRGTITFDTINELQEGVLQFVKTLEQHNKYHGQNKKSEQNKITGIYFEDKFGSFLDFSKKSSGYRDGKFLIKLGDGNVIELMVQLKDMGIAKNKGFETIGVENMQTLINELHFSENEISIINDIIDTIDSTGTKRGNIYPDGLPYFDTIKKGDKIPADFIYNIYRNLDEYNRDKRKDKGILSPFEKDTQEWNLVEKLQFLEREIYQRGFKLHSDRMFGLSKKQSHDTKVKNLKKNLLKD